MDIVKTLPNSVLRRGQERRGRNEALFLDHVRHAEPLLDPFAPACEILLRCECGRADCDRTIPVEPDLYRQIRQDPVILIRPDHGIESWPVTWSNDEVAVVDRTREHRASIVAVGSAVFRLLRDGTEREVYVVVEHPDRPYYVQFTLGDGAVFCEAVHNKYLDPGDRLTEDQIGCLIRKPFFPPSTDKQNWYHAFQVETRMDCMGVAEFGVRTLEDVYGLRCGRRARLIPSWDYPREEGNAE